MDNQICVLCVEWPGSPRETQTQLPQWPVQKFPKENGGAFNYFIETERKTWATRHYSFSIYEMSAVNLDDVGAAPNPMPTPPLFQERKRKKKVLSPSHLSLIPALHFELLFRLRKASTANLLPTLLLLRKDGLFPDRTERPGIVRVSAEKKKQSFFFVVFVCSCGTAAHLHKLFFYFFFVPPGCQLCCTEECRGEFRQSLLCFVFVCVCVGVCVLILIGRSSK